MAATLAETIALRDNNYQDLVDSFCRRTGLGWHDPTPAKMAAGTKLSVVIPAYNNAYSLATVLDALGNQDTSGSIEVIVVDDASDDDTPAIAATHPAVDIAYRLPHRVGGPTARNVGVYMAESDTIVHMDADMVLPPHVLADLAVRAHPQLVLSGFRHNIAYRDAGHLRAELPAGEPDLDADHRVRWPAPAGVPMFYTGQVYDSPFIGYPLDDTREYIDLGHGAMYHDWDLPRMVVTALVAAPRDALINAGGFDVGWDALGWGFDDTYFGATLIAAGCKVVPLRQVRGFHIDPPDVDEAWQAKFATVPRRLDHYRKLLKEPAPSGRADQFTARTQQLLRRVEPLR